MAGSVLCLCIAYLWLLALTFQGTLYSTRYEKRCPVRKRQWNPCYGFVFVFVFRFNTPRSNSTSQGMLDRGALAILM